MGKLLQKPQPQTYGCIQSVTPQSAGWQYVGFAQHRLSAGSHLDIPADSRERCLVILSGKANFRTENFHAENIGERMDTAEHVKPWSLYVPAGTAVHVAAVGDLDLAICSAPGGGDYPVRLIGADDVDHSVRGQGSNTRLIYDILPDRKPWAHSLLVVEVRTPNGNWSSYPPHRHDEDNLPEQSELEETYFHRIFPQQGFAFQRVYTDDGSLDETMAVTDGDVVLVPRGYHPYGVPHGYEGYYLNVMAGPKRTWQFYNHPDHSWLLS